MAVSPAETELVAVSDPTRSTFQLPSSLTIQISALRPAATVTRKRTRGPRGPHDDDAFLLDGRTKSKLSEQDLADVVTRRRLGGFGEGGVVGAQAIVGVGAEARPHGVGPSLLHMAEELGQGSFRAVRDLSARRGRDPREDGDPSQKMRHGATIARLDSPARDSFCIQHRWGVAKR